METMKKMKPVSKPVYAWLAVCLSFMASSSILFSQSEKESFKNPVPRDWMAKLASPASVPVAQSALAPPSLLMMPHENILQRERGAQNLIDRDAIEAVIVQNVSEQTLPKQTKTIAFPEKALSLEKNEKPTGRNEKSALSLMDDAEEEGAIGSLGYENLKGGGVRFQYPLIEADRIGHVWFLKNPDLRGKAIVISYSGIVPQEIIFKLSRSKTAATAAQKFFPEDTATTKTLTFKVPNTLAFKGASLFEFEIGKAGAGRLYADFTIEKMEVQQ